MRTAELSLSSPLFYCPCGLTLSQSILVHYQYMPVSSILPDLWLYRSQDGGYSIGRCVGALCVLGNAGGVLGEGTHQDGHCHNSPEHAADFTSVGGVESHPSHAAAVVLAVRTGPSLHGVYPPLHAARSPAALCCRCYQLDLGELGCPHV